MYSSLCCLMFSGCFIQKDLQHEGKVRMQSEIS